MVAQWQLPFGIRTLALERPLNHLRISRKARSLVAAGPHVTALALWEIGLSKLKVSSAYRVNRL